MNHGIALIVNLSDRESRLPPASREYVRSLGWPRTKGLSRKGGLANGGHAKQNMLTPISLTLDGLSHRIPYRFLNKIFHPDYSQTPTFFLIFAPVLLNMQDTTRTENLCDRHDDKGVKKI